MPRQTRRPVISLPHKAQSGLFLLPIGEYVADIKPDDGGRYRRNLGTDKERARVEFGRFCDELARQREALDDPRLTAFLSATFLPSQAHLKSYDYTTQRVAAVVRFFGACYPSLRLSDVKRQHVEAMRDFFRDCSPSTHNGNLQKLKQALNYAADIGILDANPIARVRRIRVDNRRMVTLTLEQFVRVIRAAEGSEVRDMLVVGGLTGLRPSNVRLLMVGEVEGKTVRIAPGKMKNARWGIIPISGYVADLLATRGERKELGGLLFPARGTENAPKTLRNVQRAFETVSTRAGLSDTRLYDLRHFFASQLAKQGATEQQIGRLLCHVGQSVTSRYVHQDIEDLRPFVEELSERLRRSSLVTQRVP